MATAVPLVRVVRSGLEESVHLGHVAVCDVSGRFVASAGDPGRRVFARSSMKPLQAAVSLVAIGEEMPAELVAIMCASHNGEPVHVRAVRRLLARGGLGFDALGNPPGWPLDTPTLARARSARVELHNCSGKHAGMVLACARAGWVRERYRQASHPLQRRVLRAVLGATGLSEVEVGVDGCGVPVHGMPLSAMATLFARLGRPEALPEDLAGPVAVATAAMRAHPYLVAGRRRTDTLAMQTVPGLVVKSGAEGLACVAVPEAGIGVAVKVADGGERAAGPALVRALDVLGVVSAAQRRALRPVARRVVTGGGRPVGEMVAAYDLRVRR